MLEKEECRKSLVKSTNKGHNDVLMIKLFSDTILNRYLSWERIHVCISKSFVSFSFYCLHHVSWVTLILQFSFLWYHCWMSHVYFANFSEIDSPTGNRNAEIFVECTLHIDGAPFGLSTKTRFSCPFTFQAYVMHDSLLYMLPFWSLSHCMI